MYNAMHKDTACLLNILDAAEKIQSFVAPFHTVDDFFADAKSFDAVLMNFIVIGEMVEKLSEEFKDNTAVAMDWFKIRGFRNILAHDYFGVNAEEVWQIAHQDIPVLQKTILQIM
jgi:uncharacterized protein with HEPN domain